MAKRPQPRPLTGAELNTLRGKAMLGRASIKEIMAVFGHIDFLEAALDENAGDSFGTEGWRRGLLGEDG